MTIQELRDLVDKADKDAQIQCLVWDRRLEREIAYEISRIRVNEKLVSFELAGRV